MNRRDVLSALALIGAAVPMTALALDATTEGKISGQTADSVILLRARGARTQFESGIHRITKTKLLDLPFTSFGHIKASLEAVRPAVIVGWIDDSDFLILNESLRDLNGSLWCYGFHSEAIGIDRHHFVTSSRCTGIGAAFAQSLKGSNRDSRVSATDRSTSRTRQFVRSDGEGSSPEGSWPEILGYHLASIATNRWERTQVDARLPRRAASSGAVAANGVSFVASI